MSLISKRQKMPSENPEMSIRLLIISVFLEVKALLQPNATAISLERIERVRDWALAVD